MSAVTENGLRSGVEGVQVRINQVVDESLDSTRRMRMLCEESKDAGIRTLVALDEQGEQLERIEEDMDKINTDVRQAEKALTGLEKFCGICMCPCLRKNGLSIGGKPWKSNEDGKVIGEQPIRTSDDRHDSVFQGNYIAKITKDAREDEMEDNLQEVSNMIGNLRNMAIDMNQEVNSQNRQLSRITLKADFNKTRIESANDRAQKLLK
ncbi:Synaptosomal-associated protein 25 [Halotydeus destructor]|nr:Synaptosomal-associated protein 25 [Halotydeus destructor]